MKSLLLLLTIFSSSLIYSQGWNATLNLNPFPSPYISDWETNPAAIGSMTIFNNSGRNNTVSIKSVVTHQSQGNIFTCVTNPLVISEAPVTVLDNTTLFDLDDATFPNSVLKTQVRRTGRLPEGKYTACMTIEDMNGLILAANVCGDFTIIYPEPPHLIYPANQDSLPGEINYPTLQWTPVIVPPAYIINYSLKIVELLQGQTPAQALSANYPHYLNNQISLNTFTYPIDALPLDFNKTYVWQVQALDQFGFPPAQNEGKSEIFTFVKKMPSIVIITNTLDFPLLIEPGNNTDINTKTPVFKWSYTPKQGEVIKYLVKVCEILQGQSPETAMNNYPIFIPVVNPPSNTTTPVTPINFLNGKEYAWQVKVIDANTNNELKSSAVWKFKYISGISQIIGGFVQGGTFVLPAWCKVSGQLNYKYADSQDNEKWALPNTNIKLVIKYILKYTSHTGTQYEDEAPQGTLILKDGNIPGNPTDNDKLLATATTDQNGNFQFNYICPDSMILVKANHTLSNCTSGENCYTYIGDVYRVARIIVDHPYYTSPDEDIIIQPWETKNVGTLTSYIRSYQLEATIKPSKEEKFSEQYSHLPLEQMDVYLLRKFRAYYLPDNEGLPEQSPGETLFGYEVVAKGITNQNGKIIFKRLIVNISPSDRYYIYAKSTENAPHNYKTVLGKFTFSYGYGADINLYTEKKGGLVEFVEKIEKGGIVLSAIDNATYNSQYVYPTVNKNFYATPLLPLVKGRVVRSDQTGAGLTNVKVNLMKLKFIGNLPLLIIERTYTTNATGDFKFAFLPVEYSPTSPYPINGPVRSLFLTANGFKSKIWQIQGQAQNGALQMGEKKQMGDLPLDPGAIVFGKISDEYGNGITAKIKIGDSPEKTVKPAGYFYNIKTKQFVITPGSFEFPVAKLNHQPLIITPVDNPASYIIDTSYVTITKDKQDLGTLKVYHKLHRMVFVIKESQPWIPTPENPYPKVYQWPPIQNAKIKIQLLGSYLEKTTNSSGIAKFEFASDATNFKVIVEAPNGKYYVKKVGTMINKPSKYDEYYTIALDKATYISGSVYVAGSQPVKDADVWIDFGNPDLNISTKTDEIGEYILPNVPIGEGVIVYGSKHSDEETIIGDSANVYTTDAGKSGVDLFLTVYNGMDITKLLGFPVNLTSLTEEPNGSVKIKGTIKKFKKNNLFEVFDSTTAILNFTDIPIQPGTNKNPKGIPYAELSNPPLIFDEASMELKVYKKYVSKLGDVSSGVRMYEAGTGSGVLKGKVFVNASSFNTQGSLSGYSGIYLADPNSSGQNKILIPTITADASVPLNLTDGFNVTNENGGNLNFKINTFTADANADSSFLKDNDVKFRTTLHTNIQNAAPSDIKLPIGDVVFHQVGIEPIAGDKPFNFNLDNWSLSASKWVFSKSNLIITEGILKTGTDIPIKSLDVTPTGFQFADFNFNSMLISGIVPITITGNPYFGYDNAKKYWYISISKKNLNDPYAAYFKSLPGMEPNALMRMSNFTINSKSDFFSLTPEQNQIIKLYKVGNLNLTSALLAYNDYLHIPGLGFNIPNVSQSTAVQYYKGSGGQLAFKMKGININTAAGNGVYMQFGVNEEQQLSQILDESGFRSRGVVGEENKFETNCWLYHTVDSTSVLVETPSTPFTTLNSFQTLKIGEAKTYLDKLTGGMKVAANKWNNFHFEGDLTGTKGITNDKKRLAFTVYGEIKADNQQISVKDIPTPFGGMNWIYEFENSRLIGTMDINQNMGGINLTGLAEMLIDGSGWYFLGGGTMTVPGVGPGYAAMLFGDYPSMTSSVKEKFAKASYKKSLPNSFQDNISGFLLSGAMSIPILIPNIDLELGVFVLKFGINAGGDIKVYKGFDAGGSTYGIGALGFVKAFLTMQSITCTELTGEATLEMGVEGSYQTGAGTFNLDGCTSFSIGGHIIQKFYGCDLDGCGCTYEILNISKDFAFGALMHLDSGGNMSFGFQSGTCSGN